MSREAAGAAIRTLREARDWSLAELAAATGVSIMGLSFLERGVRKPHKGTVQKVENGLGLPPGTYARLVIADDPAADIAQFLTGGPAESASPRTPTGIVVSRHSDADVLEAHAEAHLESLNSLIARLP
ncbi:MAG: helix-turn-helix transcriptional regulator, partial [Mycolicibacterium aromaticivorans]|nr:helix-turn-helix transcriptional regulator [Mycolicibacterium aromaticivorans]